MKTILITAIMVVIAHHAAGALMSTKTVASIQNHNKQIEVALRGAK